MAVHSMVTIGMLRHRDNRSRLFGILGVEDMNCCGRCEHYTYVDINRTIVLVTLTLLVACAQEQPAAPAAEVGEIAATELNERMTQGNAPLIIDVRGGNEFAAGHLPGALNIAHTEFVDNPEASLALLPSAKDAEIVVHCVSGKRASIAAEIIAGAGYTNVRHLAGDFNGWQAANLPIEN